jgi:mono/diheme cytochrome c family protein
MSRRVDREVDPMAIVVENEYQLRYRLATPSALMRALPTARFLRSLLLGGGAVIVASVVGCGTPGAASSGPAAQAVASSPDRAHIVAVYQSHCGSCHRPVAPGSEPADRLEAELVVHHKRTRLSDAEWAGLDAFLVRR